MLDLNEYLPYLINRVGFAVSESFGEVLAEDALTISMWRVLAVLHHNGPQYMTNLAELTTVELSTLSRLVGAMQRRALVTRKRNAADGRNVCVALSARGATLTSRLLPAAAELQERMIAGMDSADLATLRRLLKKLHATINHNAAHADRRTA
ncbi:MAG TPA: MarR family transcriptional regulator [Candidatus Lustribacter sp.]